LSGGQGRTRLKENYKTSEEISKEGRGKGGIEVQDPRGVGPKGKGKNARQAAFLVTLKRNTSVRGKHTCGKGSRRSLQKNRDE